MRRKGGIMKPAMKNGLKVSMFVFIAVFAVMICGGPAFAAADSMQTNLNAIADQLARWSKQSVMGKLTPEAQAKLGELLMEASQVLKEMTMKDSSKMQMMHKDKIMMMEKEWDPFDTADGM
jgi:hypothetical protein